MFDHSLRAGLSRGFTLMAARGHGETRRADEAPVVDGLSGATHADLVAALRFPLSPDWILQRMRRPPAAEVPLRSLPRGCG